MEFRKMKDLRTIGRWL